MKRLFKAFYKSLILYLIITVLILLIQIAVKGYDDINLIKSYLPTVLIFYIPTFISFLFYKKENRKLEIFKSSIISFICTYISVYFFYKYVYPQNPKSFFSTNYLSLASFSFFTSFILTIVLIVIEKNKLKSLLKINLNHSNKILLTIPISGAIIYTFLIFIGSSSFLNAVTVWGNVLPSGIILSFLTLHFFKFIYSNYYDKIRSFCVIIYYPFIILFFTIICNISMIISLSGIMNSELILKNLVASVVLFTPFFLFIIVTVHFYFLKLVSKQEKEILTQQSLESQRNYQQLKNQLSPHFLFNNINVLTSLIEENPKKAVRFSENLSHIYRYFLEQEKQDVVLVKDEIAFAKSYLELLQDRFEVGFSFTFSISEETAKKYIVSTILQQVLENVVKHNEIGLDKNVTIKITEKEKYLSVSNTKNPKLETVENSKKGIENIKKRIAFFTDEKVMIANEKDTFTIQLPLLETN